MFNALASLAQRRGRRVVILAVVFFAVAGALGAGVADRLDPYGADDPATEGVRADNQLEDAGFREATVTVVVQNAAPTEAAGARRVQAIERRIKADPDVAEVTGYLETQAPDFISKDGDSTYLAVGLKTTDDKEL